MTNSYYKKKIIIAHCDRKGQILGPIERWEAHEKAILHRAFTVALFYKNQLVLQHRKHPVFDGVMDVTSSSHQVFSNGTLQDTIEATYDCLMREWGLDKNDLLEKPKDLGTIYYRAKDKFSIYTEHEVCNIVVATIKRPPKFNENVSYGFSFASKKELLDKNSRLFSTLAPWVQVMLKKKLV